MARVARISTRIPPARKRLSEPFSDRRQFGTEEDSMNKPCTQVAVTKVVTGIQGFDEITVGGLPCGRTTLVMGGAGSGKTVFALQTLVNGAHEQKEAGLFVAFEESTRQIVANASTFGWDLPALEKK